jgi:hypothetical protein
MSNMIPAHTLSYYFYMIHFNSILPSIPRSDLILLQLIPVIIFVEDSNHEAPYAIFPASFYFLCV